MNYVRLEEKLDQVYEDKLRAEREFAPGSLSGLERGYYAGMRLAITSLGLQVEEKNGKHTIVR